MAAGSAPEAAARTFRAALERTQSEIRWVVARVPFDAAKLWGKRGQIRVKGEINGFVFRSALFPDGKGGHVLLVNKTMQTGGRTGPGRAAAFRLEPDTEERPVAMPAELERALAQVKPLRRWFEQLNPSARHDLCRYVSGVKSADARQRRAEQQVERMLATMEAERELPPVLRLAFARDPVAWRGWQRMSPRQRRVHLFGVFYYRTPEGQERRIARMLEHARGRMKNGTGAREGKLE